jgi:molecular chaperone IbpA
MRTVFDTAPLYRSSIGFDRFFDLLDSANRIESIDNWPPYDIIKTGEDTYRISMAVAGYSRDELNLVQEPNLLTVSGSKAGQGDSQYLYHGIAGRSFQRRFELADHVKIVGAELRDGLLQIDLERELPEEMKPRRIQIGTGGDGPQLAASPAPQIEKHKHAA